MTRDTLDDADKAIIDLLLHDSRISLRTIGAQAGLTARPFVTVFLGWKMLE